MNTALKDKLYNITFTLHDLTHKPIPNLYYEIKNGKELVKKGNTNGQGEISLKYVGGNTLTVFVRKDADKTMKKIGEIHTPSKNIKVKLISPQMKFDVILLPHKEQGKYWRGTYKVKSGDTLSKIAEEHHTTVSALLALNPNIKSPDKIYQNEEIDIVEGNADAIIKLDENSTVKVPPVKKTGTVAVDRKNKSSSSTSSADAKSKNTEQKVANTQPQAKVAEPKKEQTAPPQQKTALPPQQKIEVQQEHNEDKKPVAVASLSGCVCKDYDLIWGAKVDCAFRKKVVDISKELWGENKKVKMANMLMAVFAWESGGTFKPDAPNRSNSGGTGLIQIMPDTYRAMTKKNPTMEMVKNYWGKPKHGKPDKMLKRIKELAHLTPVQYLDYVKKYFEPKAGQDLEFIDFYLQVLFPVSSGKSEHVVFANSLSKLPVIKGANKEQDKKLEKIRKLRKTAFESNNMDGWILDEHGKAVRKGVRDGKVMKSEIAIAVSHYLKDGEDHKSNYSEHKNVDSVIQEAENKIDQKVYEQASQDGKKESSKNCTSNCSIKPVITSGLCPTCKKNHFDLRDKIAWQTQFSSIFGNKKEQNTACWKACMVVLKNAKLSSTSGTLGKAPIQIAKENSSHTVMNYNKTAMEQAVIYIDSQLKINKPILVGVSHDLNYRHETNNDHTTDHFVVIVGSGCDSNGLFYRFFEVGTSHEDKGKSDLNKLYINNDRIEGKTAYSANKFYTLAQVRQN